MDYNALYDELARRSLERLIDGIVQLSTDELLNTMPVNGNHATLLSCLGMLVVIASDETGKLLEDAQDALTAVIVHGVGD